MPPFLCHPGGGVKKKGGGIKKKNQWGGYNNHDEIYNTYRVFFGHIMKFSGRYSISDFEDFWKIMTFFGRYSRVIWIDFEDFWQITTFLAYILGDFEDILPPPSGWQSP